MSRYFGLFEGRRPARSVESGGRLAPVRPLPNAVSSQCEPRDSVHYVEPLRVRGEPDVAWVRLVVAVREMRGCRVVEERSDYLCVEFCSRFFGFVDDVEFTLHAVAGLIHVRSAARLGRSDFGVNRRRVESIRRSGGFPAHVPG